MDYTRGFSRCMAVSLRCIPSFREMMPWCRGPRLDSLDPISMVAKRYDNQRAFVTHEAHEIGAVFRAVSGRTQSSECYQAGRHVCLRTYFIEAKHISATGPSAGMACGPVAFHIVS